MTREELLDAWSGVPGCLKMSFWPSGERLEAQELICLEKRRDGWEEYYDEGKIAVQVSQAKTPAVD